MGHKSNLFAYFAAFLVLFSLIFIRKLVLLQGNKYINDKQRISSILTTSSDYFRNSEDKYGIGPNSTNQGNSTLEPMLSASTTNAENENKRSKRKSFVLNNKIERKKKPRKVLRDNEEVEIKPEDLWIKSSAPIQNISETLYRLGHLTEHVSLFQPLCVNRETGSSIIFSKQSQCKSLLKKSKWLERNCNYPIDNVRKEQKLNIREHEAKSHFFAENAASIHFVKGLTLLQELDRGCANIAHYAGRIMLLQHVRNNFRIYAPRHNIIDNIILVPSIHVMRQFSEEGLQGSWQRGLLKGLLYPTQYHIGNFDEFLLRTETTPSVRRPVVQLIPNFSSLSKKKEERKRFVCFENTLVPGFMKGRFFPSDNEYPSLHSTYSQFGIQVPRDSLILRKKMNMLFKKSYGVANSERTIVFIDRSGKTRQIIQSAKRRLMKVLKRVARNAGYKFRKIKFENMDFKEQFKTMRTVSLAVGVHGANLVNSIFMPPFAVLIELHPFGFKHAMYNFGGNSGLKYFAYQMKSVQSHFIKLHMYESLEECTRLSPECKVHYRDETLNVTEADMAEITEIVHNGIEWCKKKLNKHDLT